MDEGNYPAGYENAVTMTGAYGWNDFNLPEQKELYSNMFDTGEIFFDSAQSYSFIFSDTMYSKEISFKRKVYNDDLTLLTEEYKTLNIQNYFFR
ncbi:hypothetical protein [Treponema phagedenis]|uniref:hypothetical protein n=1 Tax=Treponema phagedenis TaxID=162 RepID=UPI0031388971